MRCADASELMDEVLDGRADSDRQAALLAHTADCTACCAEWSAIQKVHRLFLVAPPVSPPADFTAKVMARLARRRPAQNPWAGALALFAGTVALSLLALLSLVGVTPTAESTGLLRPDVVSLSQTGATLLRWIQAGWQIRQAVLGLLLPGLVLLYAFLSLVALVIWLGLIAGVQGALQPAEVGEA